MTEEAEANGKEIIKVRVGVGDVSGKLGQGSGDCEFNVPVGAVDDIVAGATLGRRRWLTIGLGTASIEMPEAVFATLRARMDEVKIPVEG